MKNIQTLSAFILGLIVMYFFVGNCKGEKQTITIKQEKGSFKAEKPNEKIIYLTKYVKQKNGQNLSKNDKSEIERLKAMYNFSQAQIDSLIILSEMDNRMFAMLNDSLAQVLKERTALREFSKTFDNDNINAVVSGVSSGIVHKVKLDYTTKEKKMEVRQPILILGGVTVGATKNFDKNVISTSAGVQLRNGKQLEVGLDTEQRILVGVKAPIFKIK